MIFKILLTLMVLAPSPVIHQAVFLHNSIYQDQDIKTFPHSFGPKLTAQSAMVMDIEANKVLFSKNPEFILPIASITKLMTAVVFLENNSKNWDELITVEQNDLVFNTQSPFTKDFENITESDFDPAGISIRAGDRVSIKDVFYAGLIKSANNAIKILTRLTDPCCNKTFVDLMNEKAILLDMRNTNFIEPTGLNSKNYSTAQDLIKLVSYAMQKKEIIQAIGNTMYDIKIVKYNNEIIYQRIYSTNKLLNNFINLIGAKTGYLDEGGYCFAGLSNYKNQKLAVVVLGAITDAHRFQEAKSLIWWAVNN